MSNQGINYTNLCRVEITFSRKKTFEIDHFPINFGCSSRVSSSSCDCLNSDSFLISFLFFNNSLHSILFCVSFGCTAQWLDSHILYKVVLHYFKYPPATIKLLQYYSLYSLCCSLNPHSYSVSTSLYFSIPSPFLLSPPTVLPSGNHQSILSIYESSTVIVNPGPMDEFLGIYK